MEEIALIYLSASHHRLQLVLILLTNTVQTVRLTLRTSAGVMGCDVRRRGRQQQQPRQQRQQHASSAFLQAAALLS